MGDERLDDLRARLDVIAEELADIGYMKLSEAIETGSAEATAQERLLGRARRSVLKAVAFLSGPSDNERKE
jgi:hypothetical protein